MKDRRGSDRFAVFPFSMGCMSQSAVAVADPGDKKQPQSDPASSSSAAAAATTAHQAAGPEEGAAGDGDEAVKEKAAAAAPGLVSAGVSRLMKGIRSLSQMFAAYDDDDGEEEEERDMVIGYPTDVQHVGHIGWDGRSKVGATAMGMVNAFSLPSTLSLRQLEMAMDHHHHHHHAAQASA